MNTHKVPGVSSDFTIDDIHRIRAWNHERRKGMSKQEIIDDINRGARDFEVLIANSRNSPNDESGGRNE